MTTHWEEIWRFNTARFSVLCEVTPCQDDPADTFGFDEDIEAVRNGEVEYFDARVRVVSAWGDELGSDYLGACAYKTTRELIEGHRTSDAMDRNCSIMRAARGDNVSICHYFPGMVAEAIAEARKHVSRINNLKGT